MHSGNKRILLGDYVLECTPDLDHCTSSKLVDVVPPGEVAGIFNGNGLRKLT